MADGFQWVELGLKYSKTVVSIFIAILSLLGYGTYDFFETEKNKAVHEVAEGFQQVIREKTIVVSKPDCTSCKALIDKAISEHEKGRLH